jgi:transketolase
VADALLGVDAQGLHVTHLSVRALPGSGTTAELLAASGIDASHIESAARALIA